MMPLLGHSENEVCNLYSASYQYTCILATQFRRRELLLLKFQLTVSSLSKMDAKFYGNDTSWSVKIV